LIHEQVTIEWANSFTELCGELAVSSLFFAKHHELYYLLKQKLCGRVSFTMDIWSSATLLPYLAVTSHWISQGTGNNLSLKAALISFHRLTKAHMGKNIAEALLSIIDHANVTSKVCKTAY
jgi:hypothetical protein